MCVRACSVTQLCPTRATPWTVARQAPLSTGFSRQEHWSGLPCPPPGDLPEPGMEPASLYISCIERQVLHYEYRLGGPRANRWFLESSTGFPGGSHGKASACNARNLGSRPGLGRSSGEGNGCPLQYSCLENSMDRGT